jgi:aryl sulfotransferase
MGIAAADLTDDEVLAWSGEVLRAEIARSTPPIFAKTHDARLRLPGGAWTLPDDLTQAAIHLVRDPRDVAVSLARHFSIGVDEAITFMGRTGREGARADDRLSHQLPQYWTGWSRNVGSWLDPAPFPIHRVHYEQLRSAPEATLAGILEALALSCDMDIVHAAVASTTLDKLGRQEILHGFVEKASPARFFGDGRVGGWRDRLSPAQVARIEADHGEVMERLGYLA